MNIMAKTYENDFILSLKKMFKTLNSYSILIIGIGIFIGLFNALIIYNFESNFIYGIELFITFIIILYNASNNDKNSYFFSSNKNIIFIAIVSLIVSETILFQSVIFDRSESKVYIQSKIEKKELSDSELKEALLNALNKKQNLGDNLKLTSKTIEIYKLDDNSLIEKYEKVSDKQELLLSHIVAIKTTKKYVPLLKYETNIKYIYDEK
jgi:hypothetical protein